jgi:hypothetical protein
MKDTNGNNITEEEFMKDIGHGTSPQPEECRCTYREDGSCLPCSKGATCFCHGGFSQPSSQPEEWESLIRSAVETKSAIFHMYENGDGKAEMESLIQMLQSFVGDKIRKAEERGYAEGTDKGFFQGREDGRIEAYNKAITDAIETLPPEFKRQSLGNKWNLGTGEMEHYWGQSEEAVEYYNSAVEDTRINLEALKK